ncbi:MAG: pre-peptidase C-terminal domain-containing protein, partial [Xanthomonadales bacterium]|nr:pre-peptidase C-terminal domain-containing protein [Xanthomonadales bacterium]
MNTFEKYDSRQPSVPLRSEMYQHEINSTSLLSAVADRPMSLMLTNLKRLLFFFATALVLGAVASFPTVGFSGTVWRESAISEQRLVSLSPAAIDGVAVELQAGPPAVGEVWELPVSIGRMWRTSSLSGSAGGDFLWRGVGVGDAQSQAVVVRKGTALSGFISAGEGVYELIPAADGNYLARLDSSRFPECGGGVDPVMSYPDLEGAPIVEAASGGPVRIDVLIVYTPQARDAAGGVSQIEAVAHAAVEAANLAFDNSESALQFRLVSARLANYNDSGDSANDLAWVANDSEVADWRNQLGADLVALIAEDLGSACGRGYVMRNPGPGFAVNAFQVTARGCAVGNLSYAHEHGHNLGMEHDPANGAASGNASFPYSFGHYVSGSFRTVMSYSSECIGGCTRRPYFSNPNVSFGGSPTGIVNQRDNSRTADNVASIVSAFRAEAPIPIALENTVSVAGSTNSTSTNSDFREYTVTIPAGTANLTIVTTAATGDVDLYVRFDSNPTLNTFDCRSNNGGSADDACSFTNPAAGVWNVRVYGYDTGPVNYRIIAAWAGSTSYALSVAKGGTGTGT